MRVERILIPKVIQRIKTLFAPASIHYKGMILPAKHLRLCGREYLDDEHFLSAGQVDADRLTEHFGLNAGTRLLDIGCGPGRIAIGILSRIPDFQHYRGVDIVKKRITWCRRHITRNHPNFQFGYLHLRNLRYNPAGDPIQSDFRFPFADEEFDIVCLWSVFSHMITEEVRIYLREVQRMLAPGGRVFLTAFMEDGVPDMAVNPRDYEENLSWKGPLHCVRYNKSFFQSLVAESGLRVDYVSDEKVGNGQRMLHLSNR